jgi:acetyl esterase/lipase
MAPVQSLRSRVVNAFFSLAMRRARPDAALAHAQIGQQGELGEGTDPPDDVAKAAAVERSVSPAGWPVYELTVPGRAPIVDVVHFHGGAYIASINDHLWRYAQQLAQEVPARVILPVYPLAPGSPASSTVPAAADLVASVISRAEHPVVVAGDSAGGGLALLATLALRDRGGPLPAQLWAQAPWFDVSLTNPRLAAQERKDPVLSVDYLRPAAAAWAGELATDDPRVSPLAADLRGLPPILVHVGQRDLGLPDAQLFEERAQGAGVDMDLRIVPGQLHGYWVLRLREARELRTDLAAAARRLVASS